MQIKLVIFDCDGVLVDSEPLSMTMLSEQLQQLGINISAAEGYRLFLGTSTKTTLQTIKQTYNIDVPSTLLERSRERLLDRFKQSLQPIAGILPTLERLSLPRCVASSSNPERISTSLKVTGLYDHLAPHLFSATMVEHGKPAPDLFLHAAKQMGVKPAQCLVIEDSVFGVRAAKAAGMPVLGFTGGSHAKVADLDDKLAMERPTRIFDNMQDLPSIIALLSQANA